MRLLKNLSEAASRWTQDDGNLMAAAVAYYTALSFFPILLVLTSGLGIVLRATNWGQDARQQVLSAIEDYASTSVRDSTAEMFDEIAESAALGGPLGMVTLLVAAGALFAHFDRAFSRIWNVESPETRGMLAAVKNILFHRLRAFLMLLALGTLLLVNLASSLVLSGIRGYTKDLLPGSESIWTVLQTLSGLTINTLVFALLYWIVPRVTVRFREAVQGGVLAAVIWEFGRWLLATFVLSGKYGAYGVIGSFLVVMLWIYYASAVVFLGAEYVQVICAQCNPDSAEASRD